MNVLTPERARALGIPIEALQPTAASRALARRMGLAEPEKGEIRTQHRETVEDSPRDPAAASEAGRAARGRGNQAEIEVLEACRWYRARRVAQVDKVPTAVTHIRTDPGMKEGFFVGSYTPRDPRDGSPVDFVGLAKLHGRTVAVRIEVKSSSTGRVPLSRHGEPILPAHQVADLEFAAELGAVAGVLMRTGGLWTWWPWRLWVRVVRQAQDRKQASLHQVEVRALGTACTRLPCGGPDWLAAVEATEMKGEFR